MVKLVLAWRDKHPPTMSKKINRHLRKAPNVKHPKTKQTNQKEELRKNKAGHKRKSLKKRKYCILEIRTRGSKRFRKQGNALSS